MSARLVSALAVIVALPLASACNSDGEPCDPNQIMKDRLCVPAPVEAGPAPDVEETVDGEIVDAVAEVPTVMGMFGKTCMMAGDSAECAAPAPYCAVQPGATTGYCSVHGCAEDPTLSTSGWSCFRIAGISVCTKPP